MIPDQLKWTLMRRRHIAKSLLGFHAHPATYATKDSIFEDYVSLHRDTRIYSSHIGRATYIAGATVSNASINKFCSIGPGSRLGLAKHPIDHLSTHPAFYSDGNQTRLRLVENANEFVETHKLNIGNDIWIGADCLIMSGITIGDGSVIGAGSIVTKDVLPYSIVAGNPAKLIKYRFDATTIALLLKLQWWNRSDLEIKKINSVVSKLGSIDTKALQDLLQSE
jgi:chloramphenicol O-acetyltransferase type B